MFVLDQCTPIVTLKNGYGYLKRYQRPKPVKTSFISYKPEDFDKQCRANLFMFMNWRRKSNRKTVASERYDELEVLLKNNFETYAKSWENYLAAHQDDKWTKSYFAAEAIRKAKIMLENIKKEEQENGEQMKGGKEDNSSGNMEGKKFKVF